MRRRAIVSFAEGTVASLPSPCRLSSDVPSGVLEDNSFETDRISHFVKKYEAHRSNLRVLLRRTGFGLPHVTDVDWKLDYYMKSNQLEKINEPQFTLQFATEVGDADQLPTLCPP